MAVAKEDLLTIKRVSANMFASLEEQRLKRNPLKPIPANQFNGSIADLQPFKIKTVAVDVGGLRLPITVSFKGAPSHCDLFITFSESKRNLTRQRCSLYLHNVSSFCWPEKIIVKKPGDVVKARHGTVYYIAFESSTECILHLSLHQKESDLLHSTFNSHQDGLGL